MSPLQLIIAAISLAITLVSAGAGAVVYVNKLVSKVRDDIASLRNELMGIECPFRRVSECEAMRAIEVCRPPHAPKPATAEG